jgi:alpha-beta hydrolase superfamily lysophospholipase
MSWTPCGPNCGCVRKYSRFILSFAMSGTTVSTFDARGASRSVAYQNRRQRGKARSQHDGSPLDPPDYQAAYTGYTLHMSNECPRTDAFIARGCRRKETIAVLLAAYGARTG